MRGSHLLSAFLLALPIAGCANLESIDVGVCGNGAVETGEDCEPEFDVACMPAGLKNECRLQCEASASESGCPGTMVCGVDGLCVQHSLRFDESDSLEVRANTVVGAGEFDGDGARDLLVTGPGLFAIVHVTAAGLYDDPIQFPDAPALPLAAQLTAEAGEPAADALDDLVMGFGGLFVNRGGADRVYGPVSYSPIGAPEVSGAVEFAAFDVLPPRTDPGTGNVIQLGDEVVAVSAGSLRYLDESDLSWKDESWSAGAVKETDRPPLVADVVPRDAFEDCDEIVVARRDDARVVDVYSPCGSTAEPSGGQFSLRRLEEATIHLPANCSPDFGIVAAYVNDDEYLDVVVTSGCQAPDGWIPAASACAPAQVAAPDTDSASVWVAYWNEPLLPGGEGRFSALDPTDPDPTPDDPIGSTEIAGCSATPIPNAALNGILATVRAAVPAELATSPLVLGAEDFNRDGLPDFVLLDGSIAVSAADTEHPRAVRHAGYVPVPYSEDGPWHFAHVADFNGNGIPDVVAGRSDRPELLFLNGAPGEYPKRLRIPLIGPPAKTTVGDFDGDLLPDVAFAETGTVDVLSICFGQPFGSPGSPQRIGELGKIRQILAGNLAIGELDGLDDLIVASEGESESDLELALLLGSSDRSLFSPFFFRRESVVDPLQASLGPVNPAAEDNPSYAIDAGFLATALAAGQLDGDADGRTDVAVLTHAGERDASWDLLSFPIAEHNLWLFPVHADARLDLDEVSAVGLDDRLAPFDLNLKLGRGLVAALDLGGPLAPSGQALDDVVVLGTSVEDPTDLTSLRGAIFVASVETYPVTDPDTQETRFKSGYGLGQLLPGLDLLFAGPRLDAGDTPDASGLESAAGGRAEAVDVTGDGHRDLVVLAGRVDEDAPGGPALRTVVVAFPNLQRPTLADAIAYDQRIELSAGLPLVEPPSDGDPTSFALWDADRDGSPELLLLTTRALFQVELEPGTGLPVSTVELEAGDGDPLAGGSSLSFGDFNGDRLTDLAVVRPTTDLAHTSLELLLGLSTR